MLNKIKDFTMTPTVMDFDTGVAFMKGYGKTIVDLQIEEGELIIEPPKGPFLVKSVFSEEIIELEQFSDLVAFFDYGKTEEQIKEILTELQSASVHIVDPGFVVSTYKHRIVLCEELISSYKKSKEDAKKTET